MIKIKKKNEILYFLLIPFLYPRGFAEYSSVYSNFFKSWLYISLFIMIVIILKKISYETVKADRTIFFVIIYYVYSLYITVLILGKINEGLQKLFAIPILYIFLIIYIENNHTKSRYIDIINVVANILLFIEILGATLFAPPLFAKIVGETGECLITFAGHVQIVSQYGILSLFLAYVLYLDGNKKKSMLLILTSLSNMIFSRTVASYLCIVIVMFVYLLRNNLSKFIPCIRINCVIITLFMFILSIIVVLLVVYNGWNFGARYFVYMDALKQIKARPICGYGVYGTNIKVFWAEWTNNGKGFNYAHNDMLQQLIDGGIVKLILYVCMILTLLYRVEKNLNLKSRLWIYTFLMCFLCVGICDSISEYAYFFIFILLVKGLNTYLRKGEVLDRI